jgi:hypothetical protein
MSFKTEDNLLPPRQETMVVEDPADTLISSVLRDSTWCFYCIFSGCGVAAYDDCCDPVCQGNYKFLCCEGYNGSAPCWTEQEGLCMSYEKCLCCVQMSAFPPGGSKGDGQPCCAVCNHRCGGESAVDDLNEPVSEVKMLLDDTFIVFYAGCQGIGFANCTDPMCKGTSKFCCVHANHETAECCGENGCCYQKQKQCCIVTAAACPPGGGPRDGVPVCALFGKQCGGEEESDEEPEMMEMTRG